MSRTALGAPSPAPRRPLSEFASPGAHGRVLGPRRRWLSGARARSPPSRVGTVRSNLPTGSLRRRRGAGWQGCPLAPRDGHVGSGGDPGVSAARGSRQGVQPPAAGVWEGAAAGAPQRWFPSRTKKPIRAARTLSPNSLCGLGLQTHPRGAELLDRNKKKALGPACERSPHKGLFRWPGPRNLALPQTNLKWCGEGVPAAGDPRGGQKPEPSARGRLGSPVASSEAAPVWGSRVPSPALGDLRGGVEWLSASAPSLPEKKQ